MAMDKFTKFPETWSLKASITFFALVKQSTAYFLKIRL